MSLDVMAMMVAGCSETHTRADNQDRIFPHVDALPQRLEGAGCFAVADGMGGTQDGAAAAEIAIRHLARLTSPRLYLEHQNTPDSANAAELDLDDLRDIDDIAQLPAETRRGLIRHHFEAANDTVLSELGGPGHSGTTLSLLLLLPDAICIGHLGDSRIYLWRRGELHQLTEDHNVYAARRQSGYIPFFPHQLQLTVDDRIYIREHKLEDVEFYYKLGPQEAISPLPQAALIHVGQQIAGRFAEQRQLGKLTPVQKDKDRLAMALGKQTELPPELLHPSFPEGFDQTPQPGDLFLLCTDGLCGIMTHEQLSQRLQQIAQLFAQEPSLDLLHWGCQQLLDDAIQSGSNDNISLLLVAVEGQPSTQPQARSNSQEALQQLSQQLLPEVGPHQRPHAIGHDGTDGIDVVNDVLHSREHTPQPHTSTATGFATADIYPQVDPDVGRDASPSQIKRYQMLVAALAAMLLVVTWGWLNAPSSDGPSTSKGTPSGDGGPQPFFSGAGGQALFWMPMPQMTDSPAHKARLRWRQMLLNDAAMLQHRWGLSALQLKPLHQALQARALSYQAIVALWRKVPREPQDLAPFDAALLQATGALWKLLAPTYQKYLDEMKGSLQLPKGHAALSCSNKQRQQQRQLQRKRRRRMVDRWLQQAAPLFANDWRAPLLRERLLIHPDGDTRRGARADAIPRLKRCIKTLQRAHQRLQKQSPGHSLLGPIHNRIQLHQAHIKQLTTTKSPNE